MRVGHQRQDPARAVQVMSWEGADANLTLVARLGNDELSRLFEYLSWEP